MGIGGKLEEEVMVGKVCNRLISKAGDVQAMGVVGSISILWM